MTSISSLRTPEHRMLPIALVALGITVMLLGNLPMLSSDLGPVDDHETITWLGREGGISLARIPAILLTTEVGNFGETTRFRPVGVSLKILESGIFGDNAPAWFLARSVLLGLSAAGLALGSLALLDRALGTLPSPGDRRVRRNARLIVPVLILVFLQGQAVWAGIANRLGPSENYAMMMLGIGIGALALVDQGRDLTRRRADALLLGVAFSFTLLVLTKETLVSLAPLLGVAGLSLLRRTSRPVIPLAVVVAAVGPVLVALAVASIAVEGDVYGRGFGLGRLYATAVVWIGAPWLFAVFLAALVAAVLLDRRGIRAGIGLRWWVLASGAAQVVDMFGHAGEAWLRYRLVLDLGASFQVAVVLVAASVLFVGDAERFKTDVVTQRWAALIGAAVIGFAALWGGFAVWERHDRAFRRAALAENFQVAVAAAADIAGPEGLVVVVLEDSGYGEWGLAATRYLRYRYGGTASAVAIRGGGELDAVAAPNLGPRSAPAVALGVRDAITAGVPTVCLYFLRTNPEPVDLCLELPEVVHR